MIRYEMSKKDYRKVNELIQGLEKTPTWKKFFEIVYHQAKGAHLRAGWGREDIRAFLVALPITNKVKVKRALGYDEGAIRGHRDADYPPETERFGRVIDKGIEDAEEELRRRFG